MQETVIAKGDEGNGGSRIRTDSRRVHFHQKVAFRAIPAEGRGRKTPSREETNRRSRMVVGMGVELDSMTETAIEDGQVCTCRDRATSQEETPSRWSDLDAEEPMCGACIAGWRRRPPSTSVSIVKSGKSDDHGHQAEKDDEQPGFPSGSFARAPGSDLSVNRGVLESDRGAAHRHFEGSDAVKPAGCTLSSARPLIGNRQRFNSVCTSRGADSAMRIRRRRSVGRGTQSLHRHARTGTHAHRTMLTAGARAPACARAHTDGSAHSCTRAALHWHPAQAIV